MPTIDEQIRLMNYHFFSLSKLEQYEVLRDNGFISKEMVEALPLSFYKSGVEYAQSVGSLQRLYDAVVPKDKK